MQSYFERAKNTEGRYWTATWIAILSWATIVMALVLANLPLLRGMAVGGHVPVSLGPLRLLSVDKAVDSAGNQTLAFGAHLGLLVLLAICISVAITLRFLWLKRR